jgi:hypothetical protein
MGSATPAPVGEEANCGGIYPNLANFWPDERPFASAIEAWFSRAHAHCKADGPVRHAPRPFFAARLPPSGEGPRRHETIRRACGRCRGRPHQRSPAGKRDDRRRLVGVGRGRLERSRFASRPVPFASRGVLSASRTVEAAMAGLVLCGSSELVGPELQSGRGRAGPSLGRAAPDRTRADGLARHAVRNPYVGAD